MNASLQALLGQATAPAQPEPSAIQPLTTQIAPPAVTPAPITQTAPQINALDPFEPTDAEKEREAATKVSPEIQALVDGAINEKVEDHNFDPINFGYQSKSDPDAYDMAQKVWERREAQGWKDKAGRAFANAPQTVKGAAKHFGNFLKGIPYSLYHGGQQIGAAIVDDPNAATKTAETVIGAQKAEQSFKSFVEAITGPDIDVLNGYADGRLKTDDKYDPAALEYYGQKVGQFTGNIRKAMQQAHQSYKDRSSFSMSGTNLFGGGGGNEMMIPSEEDANKVADTANMALNSAIVKLRKGEQVNEQERAWLDKLVYTQDAVDHSAPEMEPMMKRAKFDHAVNEVGKVQQLNEGKPLDEGVVADWITWKGDGMKPSETLGPDNLAAMGAEPVDNEATEMIGAAADPNNLLLMRAPSIPGASRVGGAIVEGALKPLEWIGKGAEKIPKGAYGAGAGMALYQLTQGQLGAAAKTAAITAGKYGLQKIGEAAKAVGEFGKMARTGGKFVPAANKALADAALTGGSAKKAWIANLVGNTAVASAAMPVGMAGFNAAAAGALPGGADFNLESFIGAELGSPIYGLLAGTNGIKPQLVEAIRPQLREQGEARLSMDSSPEGQKSAEFISSLPEPQRNALYETAALFQGLEGEGAEGQGTKTQLYVLNNADFQAAGGDSSRGFITKEGKIFVNGESPSNAGGELTWTAGHEAGGHGAINMLRALTGRGGNLYGKLVEQMRKELGSTGKDGAWRPSKDFQQFVEAYNANLPEGAKKVVPGDNASFEEFLSETAGQLLATKGAASVAIPDGVRDKMQQGSAQVFAKMFGMDTRNFGGATKFDRTESASINAAFIDALSRIADVRFRPQEADDLTYEAPDSTLSAQSEAPAGPKPAKAQRTPHQIGAIAALRSLGFGAKAAREKVDAAQGSTIEEIVHNVVTGLAPQAPAAAPATPAAAVAPNPAVTDPSKPLAPAAEAPAAAPEVARTKTGKEINPEWHNTATNALPFKQKTPQEAEAEGLIAMEPGFAYRTVTQPEVDSLIAEGYLIPDPANQGKEKKPRAQTTQKMWSKVDALSESGKSPTYGGENTILLRIPLDSLPTEKGKLARAEDIEVITFQGAKPSVRRAVEPAPEAAQAPAAQENTPSGALVSAVTPAVEAPKGPLSTATAVEAPKVGVLAPEKSAEEISREALDKSKADIAAQLGKAPEAPARKTEADILPLADQAVAQLEAGKGWNRVKDKEKAKRVARVGAILSIAAQESGGDGDLLQARTDADGKTTYSGRLDPAIESHRVLMGEALKDNGKSKLAELQDHRGETVFVDYRSSEKEIQGEVYGDKNIDRTGAQRSEEYAKNTPDDRRADKDSGIVQNKAFHVLKTQVNPGTGSVTVLGFSPDKLLSNASKLLNFAQEQGIEVGYRDINDGVAEDMRNYAENHAHGYKGDGSGPIVGETADPNFQPHQIPEEKFYLLNAAFGNEVSTKTGSKRLETRAKAEAAQLRAMENDRPLAPDTGDTNPLRDAINKSGKFEFTNQETGKTRSGTGEMLEQVYEHLAPDLVQKVSTEKPPAAATVRPAGFEGHPGEVAESGLPKSEYVASGFMPSEGKPKIISTAIKAGEDNFIKGSKWNSPHTEMTKEAIAAGWDTDDSGRGFLVQDANGERWVDRKEAYKIAQESGQLGTENSKGELNSQDLIQPEAPLAESKAEESSINRSELGDFKLDAEQQPTGREKINDAFSKFERKEIDRQELAKVIAENTEHFMPAEFNEDEIRKTAPKIAKLAQDIYDSWTQDADGIDEEFGTGGICDAIASEMSGIMSEQGWHVSQGGQEGDDHAYIVVTDGKKAYEIDIPPHVYESGGGYSWKKKEGVKFSEDDVAINEVPLEAVDPDVLAEARGEEPDSFMPQEFYDKNLVALHNVDVEGIKKAIRLGGLAVPSIAITKKDNAHTGFGDITLIMKPDAVDPQKDSRNRAFTADAYTGRHPQPIHDVDKKRLNALVKELTDIRGDWYAVGAESPHELSDWIRAGREGNFGRAYSEAHNSNLFKALFYEEHSGNKLEKKMKPENLRSSLFRTEELKKLAKELPVPEDDGYNVLTKDETFIANLKKIIETSSGAKDVADDPELSSFLLKSAMKRYFNEDGSLAWAPAVDVVGDMHRIQSGREEIDRDAPREIFRKYVGEHQEEFDNWLDKKLKPAFGFARVKVGGKLRDYTLSNVVEAMTKGGPRAKEDTLVKGLGLARSMGAKELKTFDQMHKREDMLVNHETMEKAKEELQAKFFKLADEVGSAHYSEGAGFSFDRYDDTSTALGSYLKKPGGIPAMRAAMRKNNFDHLDKLTDGYFEEMIALAEELRDAPTEYFESKPQRAVEFDEIAAAVVPEGTPDELIGELKARGIKVESYTKGKTQSDHYADRIRKVQEVSEREGANFMPDDESSRNRSGGFYSVLEKIAKDKIKGTATAEQIEATLKNNGVKKDELDWVLGDYLAENKGRKIKPEELQAVINANKVVVEEKVLGGGDSGYVDPGSINADENDFTWEKQSAATNRRAVRAGLDPRDTVMIGRHPEEDSTFTIRKVTDEEREDGDYSSEYIVEGDWGDPFEVDSIQEGKEAALDYVTQNLRDRARDDNRELDREEGEDNTKFGEYTSPGGENYREILFTLAPSKSLKYKAAPFQDENGKWNVRVGPGENEILWIGTDDKMQAQRKADIENSKVTHEGKFDESHWDEPNVLLHMRVKDRQIEDPNIDIAEIVEDMRNKYGTPASSMGSGMPEKAVLDGLITPEQARAVSIKKGWINKFNQGGSKNNTLFIEEIQSDWHQKGRERGYLKESEKKKIDAERAESEKKASKAENELYGIWRKVFGDDSNPSSVWDIARIIERNSEPEYKDVQGLKVAHDELPALAKRARELQDEWNQSRVSHPRKNAVPDAPFKGEGWKRYALKQAIAKAIDEGKDSISWTTGETQAERYDLSNHVERVRWIPGDRHGFEDGRLLADSKNGVAVDERVEPTKEAIAEYVGNELAEKLMGRIEELKRERGEWLVQEDDEFPGVYRAYDSNGELLHSRSGDPEEFDSIESGNNFIDAMYANDPYGGAELSGLDLKIGGEGMKGFYDRELVNIANDLGKKYGAKVEKAKTPLDPSKDSISGEMVMNELGIPKREQDSYWRNLEPEERRRLMDEARMKIAPEVWKLPITEALKKAVAGGQAMFMPKDAPSRNRSRSPQRSRPAMDDLSGVRIPLDDDEKEQKLPLAP